MSVAGIHGQLLEITVVGCTRLRDTEWFSRQDPYVTIEYASTRFRTRTCTDGGKNPMFQEKFTIPLIEGLREIVVSAWNSNTINHDDLIGNGKIPIMKVLSEGYDDSKWPIQTKSGRHAGEVQVIMHYANAKHAHHASIPYAQPHVAMPANTGYPPIGAYPPAVHTSHTPYPPPAQTSHAPYPPTAVHTPYPPAVHTSHAPYPTAVHTPYPPAVHTSHAPYPPPPAGYSPHVYPPHGSVYPPMADPSRAVYPPPPAPYQGTYPPHPY